MFDPPPGGLSTREDVRTDSLLFPTAAVVVDSGCLFSLPAEEGWGAAGAGGGGACGFGSGLDGGGSVAPNMFELPPPGGRRTLSKKGEREIE